MEMSYFSVLTLTLTKLEKSKKCNLLQQHCCSPKLARTSNCIKPSLK